VKLNEKILKIINKLFEAKNAAGIKPPEATKRP
jgi:hypothetical protein